MLQHLENSNIQDIYPLTPMQEGIYFHFLYDRYSPAFFVQLSYSIKGRIDPDLVGKSLEVLTQRHEILRTVFNHEKKGSPLQVVLKKGNVDVCYSDTTQDGKEETAGSFVNEFRQQDRLRQFDLNKDVLMRVAVLRTGEGQYEFIWSFHHILMDGWCINLLMAEYEIIYESLHSGKVVHLPERRPFREYIQWLQRQDQAASGKYWESYLEGYSGLATLPSSPAAGPGRLPDNRQKAVRLDKDIISGLKRISQSLGVTTGLIIQAAWGLVLSRYKGVQDVVFGVVTAGRPADLEGAESIIGLFVNTIPVRVSSAGLTFSALLMKMHKESLDGRKHGYLSLSGIQSDTGLGNDLLNHALVFEYFQDATTKTGQPADTRKEEKGMQVKISSAFEQSNYDLDLRISLGGNEGVIGVKYNGIVFTEETMSGVADFLYTLMQRIIGDVHSDCRTLLRVTDRERAFLDSVSFTAVDLPVAGTVISVLEEATAKGEDRPALVCGEQIMTYRQLMEDSNALACLIRDQGIAADQVVALLLPRGLQIPYTITGIWKAGAAYLPMDTGQPVSRLRWMIDNSGAKMLVTDSEHLKKAQELQWLCPGLESVFCIDTNYFYSVAEERNESMNRELWEYVAESAVDDITAGGWTSSYTGLPFSREEMDEYVSNAVSKLSPFLSPASRVLEIGCSSGLTLFALAGKVDKYTGIDMSGTIIAKNKAVAAEKGLNNLKFYQLYAHEVTLLNKEGFDVIVINSVTQNFDGFNYLRGVVSKCIPLLRSQGVIFFGDIMDLDRKDEFIRSLNDFSRDNRDKAAKTKLDWNEELFIPASFFDDLACQFPSIVKVSHSPKIHTLQNELTQFRYDTLLFVDKEAAAAPAVPKKKQLDRMQLQRYAGMPSVNLCLPGGLAYIIYTSGSTGDPKGVMVEHAGMLNHLYAKINSLPIHSGSQVLQNASMTFDISVWQLFAALMEGGTTFIYPQELVLNVNRLLESLSRDAITVAEFVPSYLDVLLEEQRHTDRSLPALSCLLVTGESVPVDLIRRWFTVFPDIPVINAYGPTEASDDITHHRMERVPEAARVPLGKPVQNMRILILDNVLQLCPPGVRGEICVTGVGVGRGYVNNEERTRQSFIDNTLDRLSPYKIYRTGDMGCWLPDGTIDFFGREDYQVKIRGFRIELGEIETRLQEIPGVRNAVVTDRVDSYGNKFLAAYVSLSEPGSLKATDLKETLQLRLPEYMIPGHFIFLDKFPLTPNGKVDRKSLPDPLEKGKGDVDRDIFSDMEERLRQIWEQVLDWRPIRPMDNFFRIGGHSLKATRVASGILKEMKVRIDLREIFAHPGLREMAACISAKRPTISEEIVSCPVQDFYPVSHSQKRMWLLSQFRETSLAYNVFNSWVLKGEINAGALEKALDLLVGRHEILRTTFIVRHTEPEQVIHPVGFFTDIFRYVDLSSSADPEADKQLWLQKLENEIFDLETGPLLNLYLFKRSGQEYFCLLKIHHIICDGWSMQLMFNELTTLYLSLAKGKELILPALDLQYKDFSYWQARQLESQSFAGHRTYWHSVLKGPIPALKLPSFIPRPELQTYNGKSIIHPFSRSIAVGCRRVSEEKQASLFMTLVAMVNTLFYHYTGQTDIILGTSSAGRSLKELESQIGFYINTLALRTRFSGKVGFDRLLTDTKEGILGAFEHQQYPFDLLVDELSPERDLGRSAIFDVLIELQNYQHTVADTGSGGEGGGFAVLPQEMEKTRSIFDLNLEFKEHREDLYLSITYNTDIYSERQMKQMGVHLENLMRSVLADPRKPLSDHELTDAAERRNILAFNPAGESGVGRDTLFSRFARQASLAPSRIAIRDKEGSRTYGELQTGARRIAGLLSRTSDTVPLTGLLMSRSASVVESILGIWQAGGTYLPLDPGMPRQQLWERANRSGITALLTTREHIHLANELQWSAPCLRVIVCLDSDDVYREKEPVLESMNKEMWEMVGEKAEDDITGGGWIDSYTGRPFSRQEMDEYADNTYEKLRPFLGAGVRVLEIGCASGITLFRIAPEVGYYLGTDLSETILRKDAAIAKAEGLHHVAFQPLFAHDIHRLEQDGFDIVIINSVIQNFSGPHYLREVLEKCMASLKDKGIIYVGDVMDIECREQLLAEVRTDFSDHQFYSRVFFDDLKAAYPCITEVVHSAKIGRIENELTRFRYDTILHIDKSRYSSEYRPAKLQLDRKDLLKQEEGLLMDRSVAGGQAYVLFEPFGGGTLAEVYSLHQGISNQVAATVTEMDISGDTVVLQSANYDTTLYIGQLFSALTTGGRVCVYDDGDRFNAAAFVRVLVSEGIQIAELTPGQLSLLLDELFVHPVRPNDLKKVSVTGDILPVQLAQYWYALYPGIPLVNRYGCAGSSGIVCSGEVAPSAMMAAVGRTIANNRVYVVNEALHLCPEGVTGEICVAGIGVTSSNLPTLPAGRFMNDPFYDGNRSELYRTGDRGRWLPGGKLAILGKYEVTVRGQIVELPEVENALAKAEGVKFAIVKDQLRATGETCLVAYIALFHNYEGMDAGRIRRWIRTKLPEYMAPEEIVLLTELPLDRNGRVDRSAIAVQRQQNSIKAEEAPRSLMEQQLAVIWEDILHRKPIGIYDNFFSLGGHSLKATRVVSRVQKELFIKLELSQIFAAPTLAQLTEVLVRSSRTKFKKIDPAPVKEDYALSHAQLRLWFIDQLEGRMAAYNIPSAYILTGTVNVSLLERSFQLLVLRHEVLRTRFILKDGEPRQVIDSLEDSGFNIVSGDLRSSPDSLEKAKAIYREERQAPFLLDKGPLLRVQVLMLGEFQYALLFTIHHIVADGWSMDVIVKELLRNYQQLLADPGWLPAALPIQYKDYAEWQNAELQGEATQLDRAYWLNKLKTRPGLLDMPASYQRPAVKSYAGDSRQLILPVQLTEKLKQLSQEKGISTYIMVVAIVNLLLYRYTGQNDIILSTPVAGRDHSDLDDQIGFYVNTLVLRTLIDGTWPFHIFLENVKQEVLGAFGHQFYPFDLLVEELDLPRDLSRSPLTDVMVTYWEYTGIKTQAQDTVRIEPLMATSNVSKLDLTFHFIERAGTLGVDIEFSTAIFSGESIDSMARHLQLLCEQVAADPGIAVQSLTLLSGAEERQLLETFQGPVVDYGADRTLPEMFSRQARLHANRVALAYKGREWTFAAVDRLSNQLANYLQKEYGIGREELVGVVLGRGEWQVISLLAVLRAGAAYVPVDPAYPAERVAYLRQDGGWRVCLDEAEIAKFLLVQDQYLPEEPGVTVSGDQLAYVLYTSGSTGRPKGCMLEHRGVVNRLEWMWREYGMTEEEVFLQKTTFTFDVSVWELFLPLCWGGKLVLCEQEDIHSPQRLAELVSRHGVSCLHFVPSMLGVFMSEVFGSDHQVRKLSSLKRVIASGEALGTSLVDRWHEQMAVPLYNLYGPTEASVDVSHYETFAGLPIVPIGRPVANTRLYVVDGQGRLSPVGVPGELWISGVQVARGYWNREELTAEKFINDPFQPGSRVYKTGDRARWMADGNIEYLGRIDEQVKVRGYRIEPGEIERVILESGMAEQVAVRVWQEQLAGYVVGKEFDQAKLVGYLGGQLPEYMVPQLWVQLESFPLSANGKLDRKALPAPVLSGQKNGYEAPGTPVEQALAAIWEETLGVQHIGRKDNFFRLGGHSLKAVRILSSITKIWHAPIGLRDIFLYPTLEELAYITEQRAGSYREQNIVPVAIKEHYPVSHAQKRLWVLSQFKEASVAYNMPYTLVVEGAFDTSVFGRVLHTIMQRHEILRTVFDVVGEEVRQFILPEPFSVVEELDLRWAEDPEEMGAVLAKTDGQKPFDLKTGPLLRLLLIRVSDDRIIFSLNMHHIISDGWSMEILGNEIFTLYNAFIRGLEDPLPPLEIQYKDYSEWQYHQLQGGNLDRHREYLFTKLKAPLPVLDMPALKGRPPVKTSRGRTVRHFFTREETATLQEFGHQTDASLFVVLLSMLHVLFRRHTGQEDLLIGITSAGRMQKELEPQLGFYVNTLVIRTIVERGLPYLELQQRIRTNMLEAMDHQVYPFDRLVDDLNVERDTSRSALFDVLVEFQNFENDISKIGDHKGLGDLKIRSVTLDNETSLFDYTFFFYLREQGLECNINYNTDIFTDSQVEDLFRHFRQLALNIPADASTPADKIEMLPLSDLALLDSFGGSRTGTPEEGTVVSGILKTAAAIPERVAIVHGNGCLSYGQMIRWSGQIAQLLFSMETTACLIGILMDRSEHFSGAVLGIWQAGHAYLPLDPDNSPHRLREIAMDSGIRILVTLKEYLPIAQELQWSCGQLRTILCVDSNDIYSEMEPVLESMNREMWEFTAERATDDIEAGGWINSFTGMPFSRREMDEYSDNTLSKLKGYLSASVRVLEIGCASGLTMFRVAPHVGFYMATDMSKTIIGQKKEEVKERNIDNISFACLYAHEVGQLEETEFDLIIINSVIQNFGGTNYLRAVIRQCVGKLKDQGMIFIGDVMDIGTREELLRELKDFQTANKDKGYKTLTDFSDHQFYSRQFFSDLPALDSAIQRVEVSNKQGTIRNEMTAFRFDALLFVDKTEVAVPMVQIKWQFDRRHLAAYDTGGAMDHSSGTGLAYVIYPSDPAGIPGAAMVQHRGLLNHLQAKVSTLKMDETSKVLQNTSQTFDISIWQCFAPLLTGGEAIVYSRELIGDAASLLQQMAADRITIAEFVPGFLIELKEQQQTLPKAMPDLKYLLLGGEAVTGGLVRQWMERYPEITVVNTYGPTEASGVITHHVMTSPGEEEQVPVGRPIQHMRIYIVDEGMELCPVGARGEICVAGVGIGLGYLNDAVKTAHSFVSNPFESEEGYERLYRTGDIGRWLPDGTIEFQGRKDRQVKVRGHRIEAGRSDYRTAGTETEVRLAAIWEDILDIRPIGMEDDFFGLGGHSLKATRLISRIYKEFGIMIEFRKVFAFPTIRQLARQVEEAETVEYREIFPAPLQTFYKVSHPQKRLWVLSRLEKASLAFHLDWAYRFEGDLDVLSLRRSYQNVISRHESLRTIFPDIDGEPHQLILPEGDNRFVIQVIDLQGRPNRQQLVNKYKSAEITTPFDMEKGPLIRAKILRTEPDVWYFLLTIHHIIADGWSLEILTRELLEQYERYKTGIGVVYEPLKIQYKDYSYWLQRRLSGSHLEKLRYWWGLRLAGDLPVLDLPSAKMRPDVQTYNGNQLMFRFSEKLSVGLNELAMKDKVSLFIVIVSVLKAVFYRYTGQTDIILGTATSGRVHKELEDQVGLFLNTLALRTQFDDDHRFADLLEKVKDTVLDAFDHQEYPFDLLVEELGVRRDLSRSPVYDVLVLMQNLDIARFERKADTFGKVKISQLDNDNIASQGDLLFNFAGSGPALGVTVLYNTDIFSIAEIRRLLAYFILVAEQVVSDPLVPLKQIPLMLPQELAAMDALSGPVRPSGEESADRLIERIAIASPGRIAVIDPGRNLTYGELNGMANRLARRLIDLLNGGGEKMVAVVLPRGSRFVRTVLAIWKAGMAYIPIDPEWPQERIKKIIGSATPAALIAEGKWLRGLTPGSCDDSCMLLDEADLFAGSASCSDTGLDTPGSLDHLAYVIYTSGSTGEPKGVMIEHRGMLNHLESKVETLEVDPDSRVLQNARLTFDISVWQCFVALTKGGATVILPDEWITDPGRMIGAITDYGVTIMEVVPSYLNILLEECAGAAVSLPHLRYLVVTGERVARELTVRWFGKFPRIVLVNAYGPTEASDDITHHIMQAPPEQNFVPLGRVVQNMRMYIVNKDMQLCPPGIRGEICIAGPGVGRGYAGDRERTEAVFLENPFDGGLHQRLYRTGDMGRWHADATLEFLGREDQQVKIRGYRIELEEIELRLAQLPGVRAAAVRDFPDTAGATYMAAFIDTGSSATLTETAVKAELSMTLPEYMIPAIIVFLSPMPLTANGKIERNKLWVAEKPAAAGSVAPVTEMEKQLVNIWADVLQSPSVGVTSDFFAIGGHSLKAIQVISRIYKIFGIKLDLTAFFLHPTVNALAEYIRAADPGKYIPIEPVAPAETYLPSHSQLRIWLLSQHPAQSLAYNLPSVYRIKGALDIPSLSNAFLAVVNRHESLRTVFVSIGDEVRQQIKTTADSGFRLKVIDIAGSDIRGMHLQYLIREEAGRLFDLENGPLIRATLLILAPDDFLIMLTMHHIITDGWSFSVIIRDLFDLYYTNGTEGAPLPLQYKDFCNWQNQLLANGNMEKSRQFWLHQFRLMPPALHLRYDKTPPETPSLRADRVEFQVPQEMVLALRDTAKAEKITFFAIQVALTSMLLHKLSGQRDFVIGVPYSGREHPDLENIVGFFVNTLPLHIHIDTADSWLEHCRKTGVCCLEAIRHQAYPFDSIVHDLGLSGAGQPLFNVMMVPDNTDVTLRPASGQGRPPERTSPAKLEFMPVESHILTSKMDLTFHFDQEDDALFGYIEYREELFEETSIFFLRDRLLALLTEVVSDPDRGIGYLSQLTAAREEQQTNAIVNDLEF